MDVGTDVAVVGAGIVGLFVAAELAERGIPVTVYERAAPGGAQSGGDSRIFRHGHDDVRLVALAQRSLGLWHEWEARLGAELLAADGVVVLGPRVEERMAVFAEADGVRARHDRRRRAGRAAADPRAVDRARHARRGRRRHPHARGGGRPGRPARRGARRRGGHHGAPHAARHRRAARAGRRRRARAGRRVRRARHGATGRRRRPGAARPPHRARPRRVRAPRRRPRRGSPACSTAAARSASRARTAIRCRATAATPSACTTCRRARTAACWTPPI